MLALALHAALVGAYGPYPSRKSALAERVDLELADALRQRRHAAIRTKGASESKSLAELLKAGAHESKAGLQDERAAHAAAEGLRDEGAATETGLRDTTEYEAGHTATLSDYKWRVAVQYGATGLDEFLESTYAVPDRKFIFTVVEKGGSTSVLKLVQGHLGLACGDPVQSACNNNKPGQEFCTCPKPEQDCWEGKLVQGHLGLACGDPVQSACNNNKPGQEFCTCPKPEQDCWEGKLVRLSCLSAEERGALLFESHKALIWRSPEDRALSAWKSKLSCEPDKYGGDNWNNGDHVLAKNILHQVGMEPVPGEDGLLEQFDGAKRPCIPFDQWLEVLKVMPKAAKEGAVLNRHFRFGTRKDALHYDEIIPLEKFGTAEGGSFLAQLGMTVKDVPEKERHVHGSTGGDHEEDAWRTEQIRLVLKDTEWGNPGMEGA